MSLNLNITTEEQVMKPVTVSLTPKVSGFYTDLNGSQMVIFVDFLDTNEAIVSSKKIKVKGAFYASSNSSIAPQVLAAIQQGAAAILTSPSPVQTSIDDGDIMVEEYTKDSNPNYIQFIL